MSTSEGRAAGRGDRARYTQLLEHAGRTTVALRAAPGGAAARPWGSGVLIAPGWVLTCAHVLAASDGRRRETGPDGVFGVTFDGRVVPARLAYDLSRPDPAAGPAAVRADLALVQLLDPATEHPCAWLSDQPATLLEDAYIFRGHDASGAVTERDGDAGTVRRGNTPYVTPVTEATRGTGTPGRATAPAPGGAASTGRPPVRAPPHPPSTPSSRSASAPAMPGASSSAAMSGSHRGPPAGRCSTVTAARWSASSRAATNRTMSGWRCRSRRCAGWGRNTWSRAPRAWGPTRTTR
ncbi:serine protease [Streptomyces lydicamycinicus]|uniref:S1 family peptidase n=1 Tax=Streptomyces lydicamycinicus TaxID=1546107 RepID=UPI0020364764|nr:serine protease [Streptomyces lydicamycinicus]USA01330.1 serine protease [Streptomyces lydicamycinicus]